MKNLVPRQESGPSLSVHWSDASTTHLLGDSWLPRSYTIIAFTEVKRKKQCRSRFFQSIEV